MNTRAIAGALLLAGIVPSRAELAWNNPRQVLTLFAGQASAEMAFEYKNTGNRPVKIEKISPDCGCTQVDSFSPVVQPGESGRLRFRYEFGDRTGKFHRAIKVTTDTGTSELTFEGTIKEWASITPRMLVWRSDEPNETRSFEVVFTDEVPATLRPITVEGLEMEVVRRSGGGYTVHVRPKVLERKTATLAFEIKREDLGFTTSRTAFVVVR